jgi:hypothetical protein
MERAIGEFFLLQSELKNEETKTVLLDFNWNLNLRQLDCII